MLDGLKSAFPPERVGELHDGEGGFCDIDVGNEVADARVEEVFYFLLLVLHI